MEFVELSDFNIKISRCGYVACTISGKEKRKSSDPQGYVRVYSNGKNGKRKGHFVSGISARNT